MKDLKYKKGIIRVEKKEYKGYKFVDIRRYYENEEGEWLPTKKGVTLPLDKAEAIAEAIKEELHKIP